jgi:HAD superfamily hydrolase (TIGR01509 family)
MRAVIFDLDGTLVDTVYGHTLAWQQVLAEAGTPLEGWKVHRLIGMSGGLLAQAAGHEIGRPLSKAKIEHLQKRHGVVYKKLMPERRPLPGALDLLRHLRKEKIKHGIATSGRRADAKKSLDALHLPADTVIIDRDDVDRAKPEPDLFLACQDRLGVKPEECYVIGDAVWDLLAARRALMLGIGLLSGGYGQEELYQAGAYRVYSNPEELLGSIYQLGLRAS